MSRSKTRTKLFFTCIVFMCLFMILFVLALQTVTNTAYFEAVAESEIKEMQQLYDLYSDLRSYYNISISFLANGKNYNDEIIRIMDEVKYAPAEIMNGKAEQMAEIFSEYTSGANISVVDGENIVYICNSEEGISVSAESMANGPEADFEDKQSTLEFLSYYGIYKEEDTYKSSDIIAEELMYKSGMYIIAIPRYDKIFNFSDNNIVIYNRYGQEELRINTEPLGTNTFSFSLGSSKNYRKYGFGANKYIMCYFSNEDEKGDYCLGIINDIDMTYRYVIYVLLILFFALVSILFWFWSEKITKPLDFFLMWIKLIRDKGSLDDGEKADMPMPKENYLLQNNIMLFFSFCLIPIIFAGAVQWYAENQILNGYIEERYADSAEFYGHILDEHYDMWRNPINLIAKDERIQNALEGYRVKKDVNYDFLFINYIHEYSQLIYNEGSSVTIYMPDGEAVVSSNKYLEDDRYIRYRLNVDEEYKWLFTEGLDTFVLHQRIRNKEGETIGYCKLELESHTLRKNSIYNNGYQYSSYLYRYADKIFAVLGSPNISDEKVIDVVRNIDKYPQAEIIELPKAKINYLYIEKEKIFFDRIWDKYVVMFMSVVFFICITLIFAASILTRATLNPIIHISNALYTDSPQIPMSTMLLGKEEFALIVNRVKTLSDQVNIYAREQKALEEERRENEKRRKDAEILTLQTQINPHFMYNIFSSIAVLIKTGQTEKATDMVVYTGNLMRMGLYRGHVMIPLKEEIDHVSQYINIQQIRYNNCIKVDINIEESIMAFQVVKFILQPIVENAIEHNIGYLEGRDLKVKISAYVKNNVLILEVSDNGKGMKEEKINRLQASINNFDMSNHLGLANINERIKLNCGQEYGVILKSNSGRGLKVEIMLPIIVEKEE
ncbi:MAG: histidine kinase [Clostridia bacterium]|nr:histidine kinase [Clostridia bacterium]